MRPSRRGWPAGRKLSITVIADLHAGGPDMRLPHIRRVVDTAIALQSDLIVLLGDYMAWYRFATERIPDPVWAAELARLNAPLGIWAILGNHDWWHDLAGVRSALADVRIPVLENEAVMLGARASDSGWPGSAIRSRIGSVTAVFAASTICRARWRRSRPTIRSCCSPTSRIFFPQIPARVALTLAGHTHGGQIRIPLVWPHFVPSQYGARFAYGHVVEDDRHLIVSGGLGTSIIPARLGVPPEIVHVTLGA